MFDRQGLEQRGAHIPVEAFEPEAVLGVGVVLHDSSVFRSVFLDDRVVAFIEQFGSVDGVSILCIPCDLVIQLLDGDT